MKKVTTKSKSFGEPAVRQKRGPGMNLGLKKPRYGKFPDPMKEDKPASKKSAKSKTSYLTRGM